MDLQKVVPTIKSLSFAELLELEGHVKRIRVETISQTWKQGSLVRVYWPKDKLHYHAVMLAGGKHARVWFACDDSVYDVAWDQIVEVLSRAAKVTTQGDGFVVEESDKINLMTEFQEDGVS